MTDDYIPGVPDETGEFVKLLARVQLRCHAGARKNGFWDTDPIGWAGGKDTPMANRLVAEYDIHKAGLMMTEISELIEAIRKPEEANAKCHIAHLGFTAAEEEIADLIIRALDYAGARDLRVGEAILAKLAFNEGRGERHGGKLA